MPDSKPHQLLRLATGVLLSLSLWLPMSNSRAAEPAPAVAIDINALMDETQVSSGDSNDLDLIWWIPEEFWVASFQNDSGMTESAKREFVEMVRPYTLVAVVRGKISSMGAFSFEDEHEIRTGLFLTGTDGERYSPIAENKISGDARMLLQLIRPILANAMGQLGENMRFYLFPATDAKGQRIADPTRAGSLKIAAGGTQVSFRLPLGSLLPPRYDTETGEKFPGNFQFNPFTGMKLSEPAADGK